MAAVSWQPPPWLRRYGPAAMLATALGATVLVVAVCLRGCGSPAPPSPAPAVTEVAGLQAFDWPSLADREKLFRQLAPRAAEFADAGFSHVWTPPPSQSADPEGYLPGEWYSVVNERDLRAFTHALHGRGVSPICDVVLNHRTGARKATCNGKFLTFVRPDWDSTAVVSGDNTCDGKDLMCGSPCTCGSKDTGENFCPAPDVDHSKEQVRNDVVDFLNWLRAEFGFGGWRFDMVLGFDASYIKEYVERTKGGFVVGEYLSYDADKIKAWISASGLPAFDFPQRGALRQALGAGDFSALGTVPGLAGWRPGSAQALLDDHDTARPQGKGTGGDGGFGPEDVQMLGYAYILTHPPFPWVFLPHLDGANGDAIKQLVAARRRAGVRSDDPVKVAAARRGLYAAVVGAGGPCEGRAAVRLGPEDWAPCGDGWGLAASGKSWAVWTKGSGLLSFRRLLR
mmetsp:Transcript_108196/g.316421  ORF Transcript_108196/g.316421 Transcript_108196/m.316421 type:complete len:454 (+) Transcript_108196:44-1405(+)